MERNFISFSPPDIGEKEIAEVIHSLKSGWITTGPKVSLFEKNICEYCDIPYAVATFSCTSALFLTLKALGVGSGDEVIVPTFTFASTAHVVVHCGATPVFVDSDPDTFQMDTSKIEDLISPRTRGIIPVHYGGNVVEMDEIFSLAKKHGIFVVEDAAHAIGSEYNGRKIGSLQSDATCFSFYATKNLSTAEGGMVVSGNKTLIDLVKKLTMYGISDSREIWQSRYTPKGNWFSDVEMIGYKANMTDLNAALGIHQLQKLDQFNSTRAKYSLIYKNKLIGTGIGFMDVKSHVRSAWHLFPILLPANVDRDKCISELKEKKIGTSVLFRPLHLHSAYQKLLKCRQGDFPASERIFERLVNVPISPSIPEDDINYIADSIKKVLL
ncbi:MAG: DegT/DnrJ/EryC1/StrS family aminotransferase [Oligoflexia bacterium]|nr:DegT/DnrJ/EryC1/StrS family aminotransferase [Oligoflexia bacterium]